MKDFLVQLVLIILCFVVLDLIVLADGQAWWVEMCAAVFGLITIVNLHARIPEKHQLIFHPFKG